MITKILYLVRHGQTEANVNDTVQGLGDPLTPHGEMQAEKLAKRAQNIDFEVLIASDAVRAKRTAEIIAKETKHSIIFSELFREKKQPTSFEGLPHTGETLMKFRNEKNTKSSDKDWHFEDEENFFDFRDRARRAIEFIEARPEKSILVVTHGMFMRMMTAMMLMNMNLELDVWDNFAERMRGQNTGVTVWICEDDNKWHLFTWNDHSHLADANT